METRVIGTLKQNHDAITAIAYEAEETKHA